ncbi:MULTISPECIES: DUF1062 domain-containing protein [unclassified Rhizobium]|jgi:hypothetical protein|uniref:DUF1062 domain-containing protein n=1 Tax=unclassified Rhizobium TaxID=2613769 RepID=UPI0006456086|nr:MULTISPECIES: DUF1062 domain-containing protein [unclassified Rhizobium]MBN8953850.1 DUF1062 domain-containing protein [Rhizobium tropici]OJY69414.1 MAG: hypothetical protein BGP09_12395 [Rhizobium sp. 60-20]RKD73678.1 hypothetical protein BJ928_10122 [Rhizobium sp. WW_1]
MCNILQVRWTISPKTSPQPWIACSGCGSPRPFRSSGKIRLNANGKRLDAWLIYKCIDCDKTWNRTLFERKATHDLAPSTLEALQRSDPDWVRAREFDLDGLKRKAKRIDEPPDVVIRKEALQAPIDWTMLEIGIAVVFAPNLRLDRLLASELAISRSRLQALGDGGKLKAYPDHSAFLRRRAKDGARIVLDLSDATDRQAIGEAAADSERS